MPRKKSNLPPDYDERLALAKLAAKERDAERLRLANLKTQIDIDKTRANLCYIHVAVEQFTAALVAFNDVLTTAENTLAQQLAGADDATRPRIIADAFARMRAMLHAVDINLATTDETDAALAHDGAAARRVKRGC